MSKLSLHKHRLRYSSFQYPFNNVHFMILTYLLLFITLYRQDHSLCHNPCKIMCSNPVPYTNKTMKWIGTGNCYSATCFVPINLFRSNRNENVKSLSVKRWPWDSSEGENLSRTLGKTQHILTECDFQLDVHIFMHVPWGL